MQRYRTALFIGSLLLLVASPMAACPAGESKTAEDIWQDKDHALGVFWRMGNCRVQEIIAKPSDRVRGQSMFLITVDKR